MNSKTKYSLTEFININNLEDRIRYYNSNYNLYNTKIVDFYTNLNKESFKPKEFKNHFVVPLADYDKMYFHHHDESHGEIELKILKTAYLDVNIIEQINKYIKGQKIQEVKEFEECMNYLADNFSLDVTPSFIERISNSYREDLLIESVQSYYKFKKSKSLSLETKNIYLNEEDNKYINDMVSMTGVYSNDATLLKQYNFIYCMILKAYIIRNNKKLSKEEKIKEFLQYCNEELCIFAVEECYALCYYLYYGNSNQIFAKLGRSKERILKTIENIAWDFINNRLAEQRGIFFEDNIILLPYIVTLDKGMKDYIKLNNRKFITYTDGVYFPVFEKSPISLIEFGISQEYLLKIASVEEAEKRKNNLIGFDIYNHKSTLIKEFNSKFLQ